MNCILGTSILKWKLQFGREWRRPVAWPWFTGGSRLPKVTNHNIMALWIQSQAQFHRIGKREWEQIKREERVSYTKWHTSSPKAYVVRYLMKYVPFWTFLGKKGQSSSSGVTECMHALWLGNLPNILAQLLPRCKEEVKTSAAFV